MLLKGKTVAVGVTGGIAAYKACDIVSSLVKMGADVRVVMTEAAAQFVGPLTFETLSGNKVTINMFDKCREWEVAHIALAKRADVFLLAPCTANIIGKYAMGIADDFLTTTLMAFTKPVVIAPAMNTAMYDSPAYRKNEAELIGRGCHIVTPAVGRLACGDSGAGKLAAAEDIVAAVIGVLLPRRDLTGKKLVVTAGGTRLPLDPVRFIGNRSSGKMGFAIASAATARGASVNLIAGSVSAPLPETDVLTRVTTTAELRGAVMSAIAGADALIMAAAPCDYFAAPAKNKLKADRLSLELVKDTDIAAEAGRIKGQMKLVVFAAETENLIQNAKAKMLKKNADLCVANDITLEEAGFEADTNVAALISAAGVKQCPRMSKAALAEIILDSLTELF